MKNKYFFWYTVWNEISFNLYNFFIEKNYENVELINADLERKKTREAGIRQIPILQYYDHEGKLTEYRDFDSIFLKNVEMIERIMKENENRRF